MKIEKIEVGYLDTNCYLLKIDDECVVVDPGGDFIKIKKAIGKSKVVGVLVTHFHQDHIQALEEVLSYYDAELNRAYEEAVMTIAICRDIRNSTYYKIDYIQELKSLKIKQ